MATFAKSFGREDEKTPLYDLNEFTLHTYKSLFDQENNERKMKKSKVPLAFKEPTGLFVDGDVFDGLVSF